jgi:VanZ family protein
MRLFRLMPPVVWAAVIFYLSAQSSVSGSTELRAILAHLVLFGVLAYLLARAAFALWPRASLWPALGAVWLVAVGYGVTDEWHQSMVPGRVASLADLGWDALGAVVGLAVWLAVERVLWGRTLSRPPASRAS